jgi:hypothetical protein
MASRSFGVAAVAVLCAAAAGLPGCGGGDSSEGSKEESRQTTDPESEAVDVCIDDLFSAIEVDLRNLLNGNSGVTEGEEFLISEYGTQSFEFREHLTLLSRHAGEALRNGVRRTLENARVDVEEACEQEYG